MSRDCCVVIVKAAVYSTIVVHDDFHLYPVVLDSQRRTTSTGSSIGVPAGSKITALVQRISPLATRATTGTAPANLYVDVITVRHLASLSQKGR
jgi:hypothetical protein